MVRSAALAGTAAAAVPCRCGHNKIKHASRGAGPCTMFVLASAGRSGNAVHLTPQRCDCTAFRPKEK